MKINKKLIKYNHNKGRGGKAIEYIAIHDTGNNANSATANAHFNYFNSGDRGASAHYFVDETQILQIVEDKDTSWAVGDGKGKYGITNRNSISIEICINDGNYSKEIKDTIDLTVHLMKKHNIPIDKVVRHYDASRKVCPRIMSHNDWRLWKEFKANIQVKLDQDNIPKIKILYKGKHYEVDGYVKEQRNYVGLRETFETLGFKVDWEELTNEVIIEGE